MSERIVVCFRARANEARAHDDPEWIERVRFVLKRAEALGATVCSWGTETFSLAFLADDLEDLIELLVDAEMRPNLSGFSVGMSQGELTALVESRGSVELGRGYPLVRALALSKLGKAGEVFVDAGMEAVRRGDLLTLGSRLARAGGQRVRGFRLDCAQPWRAGAERALERLSEPATLLGRDQALAQMKVEAGTLAIVRADPGTGGTRFLRDALPVEKGGRSLLVQPSGFGGEPLGALRRALARDVARSGMVNLPHNESKVLDGILRGKGAEIPAAAYLLEEWLSPPGTSVSGVVLIDDANETDAATLDVIAASMLGASRPFRCVARLDALSPLPAQLAPLPPGPEVELHPLSQTDGEKAAAAWLGKDVAAWASQWAARGAGSPLAIAEAIAEALSSGELLWTPQEVHMRPQASAQGQPLAARDWIAKRWMLLDSEARSLLYAVAVLGGDTSMDMADALIRAAADAPVDLERMTQILIQRRWLLSPEPKWIAFPSRTHGQVVLESLPDTRRSSWHRAASLLIESREGALAHAEAARQASLASDCRRAARLFMEASRAASSALLDAAAADLVSMARAEDPILASRPEPGWPRESHTNSFHVPASSFAAALVSRSPNDARSSYPPIEIPLQPSPEEIEAAAQAPASEHPRPSASRIPPPPGLPSSVEPPARESQVPRPSLRRSSSRITSEPRRRSVDQLAAELPLLAREALTAGDVTPLEQWAEREPMTGQRERLLNRMRAIVALERGDKGEALAVLRDACANEEACSLLEQSRSHLALAVGLAQTGRPLESLVEGLEALARARKAVDMRAEKACVAFLRKVYTATGHAESAGLWKELTPPGSPGG